MTTEAYGSPGWWAEKTKDVPFGKGITPEAYQLAETQGQSYLNWLANYLNLMHQSEDDPLGDPNKPGRAAYVMGIKAEDLVNAGVFGTGREIELPFIQEYYGAVQGYQEMYPPEVAPTELTPEESAYLQSQTDYNQARIDDIMNDIATTGQMSDYQQSQLDLAIRELEYSMQQAGIGSQQDWAELELARQQLTQQGAQFSQQMAQQQAQWAAEFGLEQQQQGLDWNKYLAELQASPSDFIERWYAERLSPEAEIPGWVSQSGWGHSPETGWQPPTGTTTPAQTIVEAGTATPASLTPEQLGRYQEWQSTLAPGGAQPDMPATGTPWYAYIMGGTQLPTGAVGIPITPTGGVDMGGGITLHEQGLGLPPTPSTLAEAPVVIPEGMTGAQAGGMYSQEELKTGILAPGKEQPMQQFLAANMANLTPEEIEWWTRDTSLEGVSEELRAEALRRFGAMVPSGDVREYARSLKREAVAEQTIEKDLIGSEVMDFIRTAMVSGDPRYGIGAYGSNFTEAQFQQELKDYAVGLIGENPLRHQLALEKVSTIPYEQYSATTTYPSWYTARDKEMGYASLLAEAVQQGLAPMSQFADAVASGVFSQSMLMQAFEAGRIPREFLAEELGLAPVMQPTQPSPEWQVPSVQEPPVATPPLSPMATWVPPPAPAPVAAAPPVVQPPVVPPPVAPAAQESALWLGAQYTGLTPTQVAEAQAQQQAQAQAAAQAQARALSGQQVYPAPSWGGGAGKGYRGVKP